MSYNSGAATMLLYTDFDAWDNWRLQVNSDTMATDMEPYLSLTDGYAIMATYTWSSADVADTEVTGQCIVAKTTTNSSVFSYSCYSVVVAGDTTDLSTYAVSLDKSVAGTDAAVPSDSIGSGTEYTETIQGFKNTWSCATVLTTSNPGNNKTTCYRFQPSLSNADDTYFRIDGDSTEGAFTLHLNGVDTSYTPSTWQGASYGMAVAIATAALSLLAF